MDPNAYDRNSGTHTHEVHAISGNGCLFQIIYQLEGFCQNATIIKRKFVCPKIP